MNHSGFFFHVSGANEQPGAAAALPAPHLLLCPAGLRGCRGAEGRAHPAPTAGPSSSWVGKNIPGQHKAAPRASTAPGDPCSFLHKAQLQGMTERVGLSSEQLRSPQTWTKAAARNYSCEF